MATDRFGIDDRYHDARGTRARHDAAKRAPRCRPPWAWRRRPQAPPLRRPDARATAPAARRRARAAAGRRPALAAPVDLVLEDGTARVADGELPADLPLGYHRMRARGGDETLLIVTPGRCYLPDDLRTWGWAAQLYAARSRDELGHRRPRRPARASGAGRAALGGGRADGQPADGADAGAAHRAVARTTRRAGATATRCTCASRTCRAGTAARRRRRAPGERRAAR